MITPPFPPERFDLAYIDLPWTWKTYSPKGDGKAPPYDRMTFDEMAALDIDGLLKRNAAVAMWVIDTHFPQALKLAGGWGLTFSTRLFCWVKRTKHGKWHVGTGKTTRANPEDCWLFRRGKGLPIRSHSVRRLIEAPVREHSRKPDEVRHGLEQLYGDVRRIELFARQETPGWAAWGSDVNVF
jgi:N6-adenosine-specific RNA methylase IME4